MGAAVLAGLVGIQRRVNAPEHDESTPLAGGAADLVAAIRIRRVDADADNVATFDLRRVKWLQRLVDEMRIPVFAGSRRGEYVEPAGRNHCDAERDIARIDEMYAHC